MAEQQKNGKGKPWGKALNDIRSKDAKKVLDTAVKTGSSGNKNKKKQSENSSANKSKFPVVKAILFGLIVIVFIAGFMFSDTIEKFVNFTFFESNAATQVADEDLKVHYIDVGQADCIIIEFPNGEKLLMDAGENSSTKKIDEYLKGNIFKNQTEIIFDYFILTHSDADHAGGAKYVLENYIFNKIYRPKIYTTDEITANNWNASNYTVHDTVTYKNYINAINEERGSDGNLVKDKGNIIFNETDVQINATDYSWNITMFSPAEDNYKYVNSKDYNNMSPIMVLSYKGKRMFLSGDAEKENEKETLERVPNFPSCNIMKLGHHGSKTSTTKEMLDAVNPEYIIISCGPASKYGHPSREVIDRLHEKGITDSDIYTTFSNGNIIVGISKEGVIAIVCGVSNEQFRITYWEIALLTTVLAFGILFANNIVNWRKTAKKQKKKLGIK